jgi:glutamate synthase (NADPH/NADH) small chain
MIVSTMSDIPPFPPLEKGGEGGFFEAFVEKVYTSQQAIIEASRCLMCADAPCGCGCPAGVDARGFIRKIRFENFEGAVKLLKRCNVLAGTCAYICSVASQCAKGCSAAGLTIPIDIAGLQRFVMDYERERGVINPAYPQQSGTKVAVMGSGPAGLGCAAELALRGHPVTVFEAGPEIGGMPRKVIPSFRLPSAVIDFEIEFIRKLGVNFECLKPIDRHEDLLKEGFKAVFIATGLQKSKGMDLIGSQLRGVYQALDFLSLSKQGKIPELGRRVVVIGGGDTALDAARVSRREGVECFILYRRTQRDMPAYPNEIEAAWNEGVEFYFRVLIRSIVGADKVTGVRCVRIRWHEPIPGMKQGYDVEGSEFVISCDCVIYAIGQEPSAHFGLRVSPNGLIGVHKETMMTSVDGIFAGGDVVTGGSTVAAAVGAGKRAAVKIDEYLKHSPPL